MNVMWDEEEGYHRLSGGTISVLVTELGELEDKDISFICQQLNLIVHAHRKRLFSEIRKKAMDIYVSEHELSRHKKNDSKLPPQSQETVFQHPPPLPKPISSYERTTAETETISTETATTSL